MPLPGRDFVSDDTVTTGGGVAGTVVTTVTVVTGGVGAGGLAAGLVVVVCGGEAAGGVVAGAVTGGLLGFDECGFGVRRLVGCGVVVEEGSGFEGVGVVAVGRTMIVGRTATRFTVTGRTLCG